MTFTHENQNAFKKYIQSTHKHNSKYVGTEILQRSGDIATFAVHLYCNFNIRFAKLPNSADLGRFIRYAKMAAKIMRQNRSSPELKLLKYINRFYCETVLQCAVLRRKSIILTAAFKQTWFISNLSATLQVTEGNPSVLAL